MRNKCIYISTCGHIINQDETAPQTSSYTPFLKEHKHVIILCIGAYYSIGVYINYGLNTMVARTTQTMLYNRCIISEMSIYILQGKV